MVFAIATIVACVILSIFIHLGVLRLLWWRARARPKSITGSGIAAMVIGCVVGHFVEIAVFSAGLFVIALNEGDSTLVVEGYRHERLDLWYYSASFYTSLGAARPPLASLRVFVACEAVTGLILITWTASFLFLLMQASWSIEKFNTE